MCTMTLLPLKERDAGRAALMPRRDVRLRIGFNRDEARDRPLARPPEMRRCGSRLAIMPIDPVSGGTWIAINDAGLAAGLLNVYPSPGVGREPHFGLRSRGEIVPLAMECTTIEEALDRVIRRVRTETGYPPFCLVLTDGVRFGEYAAFGNSGGSDCVRPIERPRMFTSSGLGDGVVRAPRQQLFDETFAEPRAGETAQDEFHRQQWPDRRELSVCMARPDASTVSYTVVKIGDGEATLTYYSGPPNQVSMPVRLSLHLGTAV